MGNAEYMGDHMEVANKVEMVELEDMEVAREDMVEEEHKATIKAFKHFSSPHSSLFFKSLFRRRATTSPTKKCYLIHIQLKKSVSSICFKRHSYDKHYLTTSYFVSDNPTRKNVLSSVQKEKV